MSFVENAILKARNACVQANMPAIADDSGLSVEALAGEPGIYSARYAGEPTSDGRNTQKLLDALRQHTLRLCAEACAWEDGQFRFYRGDQVSYEHGIEPLDVDDLLSRLAAKDGEIILAKGYGWADREKRIPFTSTTVFTVGSLTKQFTAAAILKLEMMGKLTTDDLITAYFDGVPADKKAITLHHLLTHSAGFPGAIGHDRERVKRDGAHWRPMPSYSTFSLETISLRRYRSVRPMPCCRSANRASPRHSRNVTTRAQRRTRSARSLRCPTAPPHKRRSLPA